MVNRGAPSKQNHFKGFTGYLKMHLRAKAGRISISMIRISQADGSRHNKIDAEEVTKQQISVRGKMSQPVSVRFVLSVSFIRFFLRMAGGAGETFTCFLCVAADVLDVTNTIDILASQSYRGPQDDHSQVYFQIRPAEFLPLSEKQPNGRRRKCTSGRPNSLPPLLFRFRK